MNCNNNIVKLSIPGSVLSPGGVRATGLYIKIGGIGTSCCSESNVIEILVPSVPPPPTPPAPQTCLASGTDLYGYTAIVSYDPVACGGGHCCDRALFDFYINSTFIGQANLNNGTSQYGSPGTARSGVFTINDHIVANPGISFSLNCASPQNICHQGIGRVEIRDPINTVVFASCMPNDTVNTNILCP